MTKISSDAWSELETGIHDGEGTARRRILRRSKHDIFIALKLPTQDRCFWLDLSQDAVPQHVILPSFEAIGVSMLPLADKPDCVRCELTLLTSALSDVFVALIDDVIESVSRTDSDESAFLALADRLERWSLLLQPGGCDGLTLLERRGLYGELLVLTNLIEFGFSLDSAALAWTGPYGAHQDFQAGKSAIEVKTTVKKQPQTLVISSERELDDTGLQSLFLVHISLDERRGGTGSSLAEKVDVLRERLAPNAHASATFAAALLRLGYLDLHAATYGEPKYAVREYNTYLVNPSFPRIIEANLMNGVGDVTYNIQVAGLADFDSDTASAVGALSHED